MTPELFRDLLIALYGDRYQAPAARALDVSIKTIERNTNGETRADRFLEYAAILALGEKIKADKKLMSAVHKIWWSERPNPARMPKEGDPGKQRYQPDMSTRSEKYQRRLKREAEAQGKTE